MWSLNWKILKQITSSLTLLYALNREWEPYWKWITHIVDSELHTAPQNLSERVNSIIMNMNSPEQALNESFELYIDVLEILKKNEQTVSENIFQERIDLIRKYRKQLTINK